jgi:hypothetical protein
MSKQCWDTLRGTKEQGSGSKVERDFIPRPLFCVTAMCASVFRTGDWDEDKKDMFKNFMEDVVSAFELL